MTVEIFNQLIEYFGIFITDSLFMPFFCGGCLVVVGIRAIGKVVNRGWYIK